MSKYLKPVYEFLNFNNPMTLEQIADELTELRAKDISFKVVSYCHRNGGMSVLIERTVLTDIASGE